MSGRRARRSVAANGGRVRDIAAASLECFIHRGYRLTQVADVAERTDFSVGALYRYAEGKEALLHLAVLAAGNAPLDGLAMPHPNPGLSTIAEAARALLASRGHWAFLQSMTERQGAQGPAETARQIAGELYDRLSGSALLLSLLDRCAGDIPEFAAIFDDDLRARFLADLAAWVEQQSGGPGAAANIHAVARGVAEAVSWLAINRRRDRMGRAIGDGEARAAAMEIFARTLLPGS